jgi:hypothetical protein
VATSQNDVLLMLDVMATLGTRADAACRAMGYFRL